MDGLGVPEPSRKDRLSPEGHVRAGLPEADRAMENLFDRVKDSFSKDLAYKKLHQFGA